jgi:hypothetical protein
MVAHRRVLRWRSRGTVDGGELDEILDPRDGVRERVPDGKALHPDEGAHERARDLRSNELLALRVGRPHDVLRHGGSGSSRLRRDPVAGVVERRRARGGTGGEGGRDEEEAVGHRGAHLSP